jgi:hypothetical protein
MLDGLMKKIDTILIPLFLLISIFFNYRFCVEIETLDAHNKNLDSELVQAKSNVQNLTKELEKSYAREKTLGKALGEAIQGKK